MLLFTPTFQWSYLVPRKSYNWWLWAHQSWGHEDHSHGSPPEIQGSAMVGLRWSAQGGSFDDPKEWFWDVPSLKLRIKTSPENWAKNHPKRKWIIFQLSNFNYQRNWKRRIETTWGWAFPIIHFSGAASPAVSCRDHGLTVRDPLVELKLTMLHPTLWCIESFVWIFCGWVAPYKSKQTPFEEVFLTYSKPNFLTFGQYMKWFPKKV